MPTNRRARPTIRCLTEDLGLQLPGLDVDLGAISDPWLQELQRIAPESPTGQKRILSIINPLVYRLRRSSFRGATWVDEEHGIVWLCAVRRREEDSDDDAFAWFAGLQASGRLLPNESDRLRDRAEAIIRLHRGLTVELLNLVNDALSQPGTEMRADLGDYAPARALVQSDGGVEEIWCALSTRASDGGHIADRLRELLFAELENHFPDAIFEARSDWPTGQPEWWEVVRMGLR